MTDPIADMITRIKNAHMAQLESVKLPHSKVKEAIANILKEEGYVVEVNVEDTKPQKTLVIDLKYLGSTPAISGVKRVSKPGRRIYSTSKEIPVTLGGYGLTVVSTSKGLMSDKKAKKDNVGGEVLCQIW
jgi:small subunit ribosomal protein S8